MNESPLEVIREKEREIGRRIREAREQAQALVDRARAEAADHHAAVAREAEAEAQARLEAAIREAEAEAECIREAGLVDAARMRECGASEIERVAEAIVALMLPPVGQREPDGSSGAQGKTGHATHE